MHGYEMFQQFESSTLGKIVHLEMSQMYAFLKKLERLEYIESQLEMQGTRPPRKIFHLTDVGHNIFMYWLTQPVEKPRDIRILFLLKLYFVQRCLPHKMIYLIEQEILACQRFLEHLESKQHAPHEEADFFDHVVLRSRIHQTRALLDWMRELQTELATVSMASVQPQIPVPEPPPPK
jgi:DNA-binding PadR family transcriptional regulator